MIGCSSSLRTQDAREEKNKQFVTFDSNSTFEQSDVLKPNIPGKLIQRRRPCDWAVPPH